MRHLQAGEIAGGGEAPLEPVQQVAAVEIAAPERREFAHPRFLVFRLARHRDVAEAERRAAVELDRQRGRMPRGIDARLALRDAGAGIAQRGKPLDGARLRIVPRPLAKIAPSGSDHPCGPRPCAPRHLDHRRDRPLQPHQ